MRQMTSLQVSTCEEGARAVCFLIMSGCVSCLVEALCSSSSRKYILSVSHFCKHQGGVAVECACCVCCCYCAVLQPTLRVTVSPRC